MAVTHGVLIASHFTDHEKMIPCLKLEMLHPGVEPRPLESEASVLPLGHLLPSNVANWTLDQCWKFNNVHAFQILQQADCTSES